MYHGISKNVLEKCVAPGMVHFKMKYDGWSLHGKKLNVLQKPESLSFPEGGYSGAPPRYCSEHSGATLLSLLRANPAHRVLLLD